MLIAFWIVTALTALAFLGAGGMKAVRPVPALREAGMGWVDDFAVPTVKLIAIAEVIGALGLVLPPLTGIVPILSPIAAVCLAVIMAGAIAVHVRRKENPAPAVVLTLLPIASAILGFAVFA